MSKMSKAVAVLGVVAGLGVAAMPLATYATVGNTTNSETINLNVQVTDTIKLESNVNNLNLQVVNGATPATGTVDFTVTTGNSKGYTLNAVGTDLALEGGTDEKISMGAAGIGKSLWGIEGGNLTSGYVGLNTTTEVKRTTTAPAGGSDTTTVTFGVSSAADQAAGTYKGTATFTATANI